MNVLKVILSIIGYLIIGILTGVQFGKNDKGIDDGECVMAALFWPIIILVYIIISPFKILMSVIGKIRDWQFAKEEKQQEINKIIEEELK